MFSGVLPAQTVRTVVSLLEAFSAIRVAQKYDMKEPVSHECAAMLTVFAGLWAHSSHRVAFTN